MNGLLEPAVKVGIYAAVLTLIGAHVARLLLRTSLDPSGGFVAADDRRAASLAVSAAALLALMLVLRVAAHSVVTFGWTDGLTWDNLVLIGLRSRWGRGWRWQFLAALIGLAMARWSLRAAAARRPPSGASSSLDVSSVRPGFGPPLLAATLSSLVIAATLPLLGHAAGSPSRMAIDGLHVVAAGAWLGTLAVLVVLRAAPPAFGQFSPIAMIAVSVVVATGASLAWLYVEAPSSLWTAPYGQLLSLKLCAVGGAALCGLINWRSLRDGKPPAVAWLEVLLAIAVVIVTAVLTETEH